MYSIVFAILHIFSQTISQNRMFDTGLLSSRDGPHGPPLADPSMQNYHTRLLAQVVTRNRWSGYGWQIRGLGRYLIASRFIRSQSTLPRWLRRSSTCFQSQVIRFPDFTCSLAAISFPIQGGKDLV